jgi:hypothetical protein
MEEDIKILEQFLYGNKLTCENCEEKCNECYIEYEEVQAVARLIKGYRELEIENQSYRDYLGEPPCYDNASYIPKSKIKEKIEELKKEPLKIKQNNKYYFETDAYNKIIIQVLQELIED